MPGMGVTPAMGLTVPPPRPVQSPAPALGMSQLGMLQPGMPPGMPPQGMPPGVPQHGMPQPAPGLPPGVTFARPPRAETLAAAQAGDPVAIFIAQYGCDYSSEQALKALPIEKQCKVLNEGPLRGTNASAVLMSRIRRAQAGP